ncbi:MAG: S41 family peptidase [Rhodothermales bacterium]|nr:S41 family peptidase [Rhodothermales bacterium]
MSSQYVEALPGDKLAEGAIAGMLAELDPHSTYISAAEIASVQEGFQGSFGGIGVWFEVVNVTPRVSSVISDGPSESVGLRAGDRIILVDDSTAVGPASRRIQYRLKGRIGTDVKVSVERRSVEELIDFNITRGKIPLYSIDTAYMIEEGTGYVRINRFATTTHAEFMQKVAMLAEEGLERLLVDLRSNPGGVMEPAVQIADEFLGGDYTIVETRGRSSATRRIDKADAGDALEAIPVIVLVDEFSASSSEIVAGALQDNDRGLIVGQRTFGKALVQQQFPLTDGSYLHLTVAKYYTPAGRLIQTPYDDANMTNYLEGKLAIEKNIDALPDSVKFVTPRGRTVVGSGGVYPDLLVLPDSSSSLLHPLTRAVLNPGHDVRFVRNMFDEEREAWMTRWKDRKDDFVASFDASKEVLPRFWRSLESEGITFGSGSQFNQRDRLDATPTIATFLKARIAQQLYGTESWYPLTYQFDREIMRALEAWKDAEELAGYHGWTEQE